MNPATAPLTALLGAAALLLMACADASAGAPGPDPADAPAPEGGSPVLPADALGAFGLIGVADAARMEIVAVPSAPFAKAVRVETLKTPPSRWAVQLHATSAARVEKGDVLLAEFSVRAAAPAEAHTVFVFELGQDPWTKSIDFPADAGPEWKRFRLPFVSRGDYDPGQASVNFQLGFAPQTLEIGGVSLTNYRGRLKVADLPRTRLSYAGAEPDAPWRKAAAERIENVRRADLTVLVTGADGKPLPGAAVSIRMLRHAFGFGSAVAAQPLTAETDDGRRYRATVSRLFNKVVFENDLKWPGWEPTHNREWTMKALRWLEREGIAVRGHCLVWPSWQHMPKDVQALKGDPEALRKRIHDHLWDEVAALKGRIVEWDVINEPFSNHDVMDILGDDVMVEWFRRAREADPDAELYLNDYNILSAGGTDAAHQAHFEKTLKFLIESGAPLGGIGLQGHFNAQLTPPARLLEVLDRFAALDLPLQVTEFDVDVPDEALQADYLRDFLTLCFSHPKVKGVLMWGFWEGRHWKPDAALFRKDWSVKPNGQVWTDLVLKTWWSEAKGKADAAGQFKTRGFLGDYEITVEAAGITKTVRHALPLVGATVTVAFD